MKKLISEILILSFLFFTFSCTNEDDKTDVINQESSIDSYLSTTFADSTVIINDGAARIILNEGIGSDFLEVGDSVKFYYVGYIFSNGPSTVFATNNPYTFEDLDFELTDQDSTVVDVKFSNQFISGLNKGLVGMKNEEHSYILFSSDDGFKNNDLYNVPALSSLIFEVWITDLKKN
ncbi:MAG: FKBP-type peptidyl-prolyl cis-trans isomerase [Bacteroidales bacterium]